MDYKKHYDQLIERGQGRLLEGYSEKHHIIPRCMGGSDDVNNLVALTAAEHYVAHQLLVKMYPDNHKLVYAAHRMTSGNSRNNKMYEWLRRRFSEVHSNRTVTQETRAKMSASKKGKGLGEQNNFYGKTHSEETKAKLRKPKSEATKEKLRIAALNRPPMSEEQKEKISKGMMGRMVSKESREKSSRTQKGRHNPNKGKTYEEIYGAEKAAELRELCRLSGKKNKGKLSSQKGRTYEEMYGIERAKELKQKVKRRAELCLDI